MRLHVHAATLAACVLAFTLAPAHAALAQSTTAAPVRPEVFGSIGFGHLATPRRTMGDGPLVGGGVAIQWRRLGVDVEADRMFGLEPRRLSCAIQYGQTCYAGRQGASTASLISANALVTFGRRRVEPFVTGGMGVLLSTHVEPEMELRFSGIPNTPPISVRLVEQDRNDRGFAINVGGGVRVPMSSHLLFRLDARLYNAVLLSSYNQALIRVSARVGYRW